jgi:hypothetical protein
MPTKLGKTQVQFEVSALSDELFTAFQVKVEALNPKGQLYVVQNGPPRKRSTSSAGSAASKLNPSVWRIVDPVDGSCAVAEQPVKPKVEAKEETIPQNSSDRMVS